MSHTHGLLLIPFLVAALLASACQPIQPSASADAPVSSYTPRYEPAACKYDIPVADNVECGYLIVPEDRSQPDGPPIRIQVLNFKAKAANPAADPVIFVQGGPGAPTLLNLYMMDQTPLGDALRGQRDALFIEHRGSNMSEPAFYCPEMEADLATLAGMSLADEIEWSASAYRTCHDRLAAEGRRLSSYGPVEMAADVADLRVALGYDQVDIYGSSWGTLISLYLLRDHPEGIRSAVLDGTMPPQIFQTGNMLRVTQAWLDTLFHDCGDDSACAAAYPDLETVFYDTLTQLRSQPVTVTVEDDSGQSYDVQVDDLKYANYVLTLGPFADSFATIPAGIMSVHDGDVAAVAKGWLTYLAGRHGPTGPGTWGWSSGLLYADQCLHEEANGSYDQAVADIDATESVPSLHDWAKLVYAKDWMGPCAAWNVTPAPGSDLAEPVASDVPTLLLVSRYDAFFAPDFAGAALKGLSHGDRLDLPVAHLAGLTSCGADLLAQFLADPSHAPDAVCIQQMQPSWTLPAAGAQ